MLYVVQHGQSVLPSQVRLCTSFFRRCHGMAADGSILRSNHLKYDHDLVQVTHKEHCRATIVPCLTKSLWCQYCYSNGPTIAAPLNCVEDLVQCDGCAFLERLLPQ